MSAFTDLLAQARESGCLPMGLTFDQETAEDLDLSELEFRDAVLHKCRFLRCDLSGAAFFELPAGILRLHRLPPVGVFLAGLPSHRLQGRRRGFSPQPPEGHGAGAVPLPLRPLHRRPLGPADREGM